MKAKVYICIILYLSFFTISTVGKTDKRNKATKEYEVKAAFIYNFMNFIEWPQKKDSDSNEIMVIGIPDSNVLDQALEIIKSKKIKGRSIIIRQLTGLEKPEGGDEKENLNWLKKIEAIRNCHVLFFSRHLKKETIENILNEIYKSGVLTIGESENFLENGGIVNFTIKDKKIRFEINLVAATDNGLKIRSKLLKLADRVIMEASLDKTEGDDQGYTEGEG